MKENKKKIVNVFKYIKEARKDPRKKAIMFFIFYFIFFAILILLLRVNKDHVKPNNEFIIGDYKLTQIKSNNYHYIYEFNTNDKTLVIDGEKYNDSEIFTLKENNIITSYYKNSKECLKKDANKWIKSTDPNTYSYLTDINTLEKILEKSTKISQTEYENNKKELNYEISTTTLVKELDGKNIDIDDLSNKIVISINKAKEVEGFILDLSPYFTYINNKSSKVVLKLSYDNFNNIEEILNPIND